jgi:DNA adenine methylase
MDGGPIGGFEQNGAWKIGARYYRETLVKRIEAIALKRDSITVLNEDGIEVIRKYVRRKRAFIYIDPPYYEKGPTLYLNHCQREDHEKLASVLNRHPEAFWALTYDDSKEIRALYSKRQILEYSLNYNAYESRRAKEIMIVSDALCV